MSQRNHHIQLSVAEAVSSAKAFQTEAGPSKAGTTNPNTFKAPAHKHAHHLHSIPPREKSTRTLIIDHMLWVHGRTRFAQARAELGMTDRTGGPSSSNYAHRKRPENYEEEALSDGEDVSALKARREPDEEEERLHAQDLQLARSLRLRAEGLEKVINSMLLQPPPAHLHFEDDFFVDPNQHTLPNGVRLRLALGTLVNDFFTRQAPPPPFRHKKHVAASLAASSPMTGNASESSSTSAGLIPASVNPLISISSFGERNAEKRALKRSQKEQSSTGARQYSSHSHTNLSSNIPSRARTLYLNGADPDTANSPPAFRCPRHLHTGCEICVEAKEEFSVKINVAKGKGRDRSGSTATSSTPGSTFAAPSWPSTSSSTPGLGSSSNQRSTPVGIAPDGGGLSGYQDPAVAGGCSVGVGEGLLKPSLNGTVLRRRTISPYTQRSRGGGETEADSTGSGYTKLSELLPRFLRLSALVMIELGREVREGREGKDPDELRSSPGSTTKQGVGGGGGGVGGRTSFGISNLAPSSSWYQLVAGILTRAVLQGYLTAGWRGVFAAECLMGVGLGIDISKASGRSDPGSSRDRRVSWAADFNNGDENDANVEADARQASPSPSDDFDGEGSAESETDILTEDEELYKEFNPDDLPSLQQAIAILFPSLGLTPNMDSEDGFIEGDDALPIRRRRQPTAAELEFGNEMNERLRKFFDIPDSTPDLSTHMEDLAWQYPAEPVERAAVRFVEAIAAWRGKPELEGYKKKPPRSWPSAASAGSMNIPATPIPLESIVHSNPTSPTTSQALPPTSGKRPSIDDYFISLDEPENQPSAFSTRNGGTNAPSTTHGISNNVSLSPTASFYSQTDPAAEAASFSPQPPQRPNSFPQSILGPTQYPDRPSPRSAHSVPAPGLTHNPMSSASVPSSQYAYYPQNSYPSMSSSQSAGSASGLSQQPQQRSLQSSLVGQQIPVWNPATGAWMSPDMGSIAGPSGNKRTRSSERDQGQNYGPDPKRQR